MESYAFLAAQRDCFSKLSILNVDPDLKTTISFAGLKQQVLISVEDIPSYYVRAITIVSAKDWILENTKFIDCLHNKSLDRAIAKLYLEKHFRDLVKSASIKRGILTYYEGLNKRSLELTSSKEEKDIDYSKLLASKALEDGYTLQEVKGSHFVITSPTGKKNSTTLNSCTCSEFDEHKDCLHLRLAQVISKERSHLGYLLR